MNTIPLSKPDIGPLEKELVNGVLESGWLTMGDRVRDFERDFAKFCGYDFAVAVSSGTMALQLAVEALNMRTDGIIIPTLTFAASASAAIRGGMNPVFCDVDHDGLLSADAVKAAIDISDVSAVMPVALYGCWPNVDRYRAAAPGRAIIVDAAEATGLKISGADIVTYSFYGNKILTTGEGGMVVTNVPSIAKRVRHLSCQGCVSKWDHNEVGLNGRMTDMAAAIGLGQLARYREIAARLSTVRRWYSEQISVLRADTTWLVNTLVKDRDFVSEALADMGIETRPFFAPLHMMRPYKRYPYYGSAAYERLSRHGLSLPTYPRMTQEEVTRVCHALKTLS